MQAAAYDVIIAGGGIVGLSLACALAKQTSLSIAVLEAKADPCSWSSEHYYHRVSAIALSSRRIFEAIDVWDLIKQKRVSPFTQIKVWDGVKKGEIHFDSKDIGESALGYIIENNAMQAALFEKIAELPQIHYLSPIALSCVEEQIDCVTVRLADGRVLNSKLMVAADGAQSWLRQQVNIPVMQQSYDQAAIVAMVHTAEPHHQVARQVFLSTGPLAFLPLKDANTSSIVWSVPTAEAERLLALDDAAFMQALSQASTYHIVALDKRYRFPLQKQQAVKYIKHRIALVGDAAHVVHPLAGQGVNIGLLDAASLVDVIEDALTYRRDIGRYATLRRYERWRKADNQPMLTGIDLIKQLFASEKQMVQSCRSFGLAAVNQLNFLRNFFSRQAVGNRFGLPRLAKYSM